MDKCPDVTSGQKGAAMRLSPFATLFITITLFGCAHTAGPTTTIPTAAQACTDAGKFWIFNACKAESELTTDEYIVVCTPFRNKPSPCKGYTDDNYRETPPRKPSVFWEEPPSATEMLRQVEADQREIEQHLAKIEVATRQLLALAAPKTGGATPDTENMPTQPQPAYKTPPPLSERKCPKVASYKAINGNIFQCPYRKDTTGNCQTSGELDYTYCSSGKEPGESVGHDSAFMVNGVRTEIHWYVGRDGKSWRCALNRKTCGKDLHKSDEFCVDYSSCTQDEREQHYPANTTDEPLPPKKRGHKRLSPVQ